ncbi:MAG: DUF2892 domain-containing protein [Novosphingobium sp.]|nr:DUF2892 domain-containing protein [Novosphingobium sp.]MBX9643733.1 DUF2892 domain-containing protein [Novosphingobium sp.]
MTLDSAVFRFAGVMVLASLALAHWVHPGWLWLTAFAGLNMLQAGFSGFCPVAAVFKRLGVRPGASFK